MGIDRRLGHFIGRRDNFPVKVVFQIAFECIDEVLTQIVVLIQDRNFCVRPGLSDVFRVDPPFRVIAGQARGGHRKFSKVRELGHAAYHE